MGSSLKHKKILERHPDSGWPLPRPSVCLYKMSLKTKKELQEASSARDFKKFQQEI